MLPTCTRIKVLVLRGVEWSKVFAQYQTSTLLFSPTVSLVVPQPAPPQTMLHPPLCLFLLCNTKQKRKIDKHI